MAGFSRKAGSRSSLASCVGSSVPARSLQHEWAGERLLDGHLLVDREPDEQRERVVGDQRAGLRVVREVQAIGHEPGSYPPPDG